MSATSRNLIWNSVLYVAYQYAFWRRTRVWCEKQVQPYYSKLATLIVYYKSCHLVQMRPFRFGSGLLYYIYFFAIRPLTIIKKKLYQFIFQLPTLLLLSTATMEIKSFWHLPFRSSQLQLKLILPLLLLLPPPTLQCQPKINKAENFVKMSCSKQHLKMQQQ